MTIPGGARVFGLSPSMILATNAAVFLARRPGHSARFAELCSVLGASEDVVCEAVGKLARKGILDFKPGPGAVVGLSSRAGELTLADVAKATGEWSVGAGNGASPKGRCVGLEEALAMVRRGLLADFEQVRILSLARTPG